MLFSPRRPLKPLQPCLFLIFLLLLFCPQSHAAHSRRRIVVSTPKETYDRVITDFSPQGRLSQVDYGMEAAQRGSCMAAMKLEGHLVLVMAHSSFGKLHRLDHGLWLATTGLSGDARRLAQYLRTTCQNHRLEFGEVPTPREIADQAGQYQHALTRSGGIRPLGCTGLVLGVEDFNDDDDDDDRAAAAPRQRAFGLFRTEAGGLVLPCDMVAAGMGQVEVMKDLQTLRSTNQAKHREVQSDTLAAQSNRSLQQLSKWTANMVTSVLRHGKSTEVDVWVMEHCKGARGNIKTRCYQNVNRKGLRDLQRTLLAARDESVRVSPTD
eukprot:Nitzschia sp. Nitz4//scaffold34_size148208//19616//20584//NITZ4_002959-RA/size148208-processed-gene-0.4-mRNA-1//1//CDS//3329548732//342//frame0